jgi:transcriptional regulator with XRE-family HTH domain
MPLICGPRFCTVFSDVTVTVNRIVTKDTMRKKIVTKDTAFAKKLNSLMISKGLTQQKIANDAGVSRTAVIKWLRGSIPPATVIFNLASANGVSAEWLLDIKPQKEFDAVTLVSNTPGVKSEIEQLAKRLKRATAQTGKKAELARFMGVAPARVSEWLSGQEPGGEYALKLLRWVTEQERKK